MSHELPENWLTRARKHSAIRLKPALPRRFLGANLDEAPRKLQVAARTYLEGFFDVGAKGIAPLFLGRAQSYKTHTASWLCERIWCEAKVDCAFVECAEQFPRWERERFFDGARVHREIEALKDVTFVVLDDITLVHPTNWNGQLALEIVNHRFNRLLPTLITGNVQIRPDDYTALEEFCGVALARRIMDQAVGFRVVL